MAPEYHDLILNKVKKGTLNFEKCDVYSLGVTLI